MFQATLQLTCTKAKKFALLPAVGAQQKIADSPSDCVILIGRVKSHLGGSLHGSLKEGLSNLPVPLRKLPLLRAYNHDMSYSCHGYIVFMGIFMYTHPSSGPHSTPMYSGLEYGQWNSKSSLASHSIACTVQYSAGKAGNLSLYLSLHVHVFARSLHEQDLALPYRNQHVGTLVELK